MSDYMRPLIYQQGDGSECCEGVRACADPELQGDCGGDAVPMTGVVEETPEGFTHVPDGTQPAIVGETHPYWRFALVVGEPEVVSPPIGISEVPGKPGHPIFLQLLDELREMHQKKTHDYGSDEDPFGNIRGSVEIGIEPWIGAWIRARDKVYRINRFIKSGSLVNESVEDSLKDLASYCLIALTLLREERAERNQAASESQYEYEYREASCQ